MSRPNVFVTRALPEEAFSLLKERCDVEISPKALSKQELLTKLKGRDAVMVVSGTSIDEEICKAVQSHCKIFAGHGVGYNNIDVDAATKHGIFVSFTPDVVTDATADLAFTLLTATARRIVECDRFVRSGQRGWGPTNMIGTQVSGKTLGVIGGGRIGRAVAQRAKGFNMNIIYTDIKASPEFEAQSRGKFVDKATLLQEADFISLHVPLLPATRHYIGASELRLMKKTAILVNASRGPVVDEKALVEALRTGEIAGAGLDVFEREPEVEQGLIDLPNVILTPHIGTSTMDTRIEMGNACARSIFAALDGQIPPSCLNPQVKSN